MVERHFSLLEKMLPGFEVRQAQVEMAGVIQEAFHREQTALIEAGTGTGKSLAYLLPALSWAAERKETVVISTHTIALQEQLIQKDIPQLMQILNFDLNISLIKGMHNYVCLKKYNEHAVSQPDFVHQWVKETKEGTRSELPQPLPGSLWKAIEADSESCTHARCPFFKQCYYYRARRQASEAHLLIVNHHLLFADLSARLARISHQHSSRLGQTVLSNAEKSAEGRVNLTLPRDALKADDETDGQSDRMVGGKSGLAKDNFSQPAVLPAYRRLIIDEAHHVEGVATEHFSKSVSNFEMNTLLDRLSSEKGGKLQGLRKKILKAYPGQQPGQEITAILDRLDFDFPVEKRRFHEALGITFLRLSQNASSAEEGKRRIQNQDPFWEEAIQPAVCESAEIGKAWIESILCLEANVSYLKNKSLKKECEDLFTEIQNLCQFLTEGLDLLLHCAYEEEEKNHVRWIEVQNTQVRVVVAKLDLASLLSESLFSQLATVVLCSATLSTNRNFSFVKKRLGIPEHAIEKHFDSPFEYSKQVFLSVPVDLPDPLDSRYIEAASETIWETVQICKGDAFVLFTSYAMLQACAHVLAPHFDESPYPLYCQGKEDRGSLLGHFRAAKQPVLFGTDAFWEGVDVSLKCVIIVKLPFKSPQDPLFQARSDAIAQAGGASFFEYALPQAVMKFKQGFGRLIRNKNDKGAVICLDPRLIKKGYGKQFLKSLPQCDLKAGNWEECRDLLRKIYQLTSNR